MSKNQQKHQLCFAAAWSSESPLRSKLKKSVRFAFLSSYLRLLAFHPYLLLDGEVGVAGFEPATLRLSSACSNQLSYTPGCFNRTG